MFDIDEFADTGLLFDNHYKLIRPLNTEGGTADVWLALDTNTVKDKKALDEAPFLDDASLTKVGLLVAIKVYRPRNALDIQGEQKFREEYMIVYNCQHANLIHPTYYSIFEDTPYLVLPYCQRGSSELMIGNFVNDKDIWRFIRDVAAGLDYLHHCTPPIIHQDIKPANVLINDNGNYAITDFGISAKRIRRTKRNATAEDQQDIDEFEEYSGTFAYMAPERFELGNVPSAESDIWSFGATLYELITGTVPFGEEGGQTQTDGKVSLSFNGINISKDIKQLVCDCLSKQPLERPTSEQLLEAASIEKYSSSKKKKPNLTAIIAAVLALITVGLVVSYFISRPSGNDINTDADKPAVAEVEEIDSTELVKEEPVEELFENALSQANSDNPDDVKAGIAQLEDLAQDDFVPALYELAKTYGGMASDEDMEMKRKSVLGIKLGNPDVTDPEQVDYTPAAKSDNDKAINYYTRIVNLSDTEHDDITMKSAYRLGLYYTYLIPNNDKAKSYFEKTKSLAAKNGNDAFEEAATAGIETINENEEN